MILLFSADFFLKFNLSGTLLKCQTLRLDLDQDRQNVSPDLGPNYLQKLSADDKSRC